MCHTVSRPNNKAQIKRICSQFKRIGKTRGSLTPDLSFSAGDFFHTNKQTKTRKRELTQLTLNINVSVWGFMEC